MSRTEFNGCKPATVRRDLKEPLVPVERSHEERVTFRWHRFLSLTYFVVTASTAQLCLMTQDEIRERKLREAQETTGGWAMRISDCPHSIEQRAFRENAYLEWMTCLFMWSPLESKDGPGRHSGKDGTDNRTTSADTSQSRMCLDDATTTG